MPRYSLMGKQEAERPLQSKEVMEREEESFQEYLITCFRTYLRKKKK
jgi:hypothetical protein